MSQGSVKIVGGLAGLMALMAAGLGASVAAAEDQKAPPPGQSAQIKGENAKVIGEEGLQASQVKIIGPSDSQGAGAASNQIKGEGGKIIGEDGLQASQKKIVSPRDQKSSTSTQIKGELPASANQLKFWQGKSDQIKVDQVKVDQVKVDQIKQGAGAQSCTNEVVVSSQQKGKLASCAQVKQPAETPGVAAGTIIPQNNQKPPS